MDSGDRLRGWYSQVLQSLLILHLALWWGMYLRWIILWRFAHSTEIIRDSRIYSSGIHLVQCPILYNCYLWASSRWTGHFVSASSYKQQAQWLEITWSNRVFTRSLMITWRALSNDADLWTGKGNIRLHVPIDLEMWFKLRLTLAQIRHECIRLENKEWKRVVVEIPFQRAQRNVTLSAICLWSSWFRLWSVSIWSTLFSVRGCGNADSLTLRNGVSS